GVLGGAKVSDKLALLEVLAERADRIVIGGGMCFTLIKAAGGRVGDSLVEEDQVEAVKAVLDSGKLVLPVDVVAANRFAADADSKVVAAGEIPDGWQGLDIGPESTGAFV